MKKVLSLILVMGMTLLLVACGPEIEDTNGEDNYELAEITEENIINQDLGGSSYSCSPSSENKKYMSSTTKFKANDFSGVAEIYMTNLVWASDFTVNVSSLSVDSGNFGLFVLLDDEIVHEFKIGELSETYVLEDVSGTVSIVFAGESADFKFWIDAN